jgi:hypothetical protein
VNDEMMKFPPFLYGAVIFHIAAYATKM